MRTITLVAFFTLFGIPLCAIASDDSAAVCMAVLADKNAWVEKPSAGRTKFGHLLGVDGEVYKFKSDNGRYIFACEIRGNRVHTGQAPTELGHEPTIIYSRTDEVVTYELNNGQITVLTTYDDGTTHSATFALETIERNL